MPVNGTWTNVAAGNILELSRSIPVLNHSLKRLVSEMAYYVKSQLLSSTLPVRLTNLHKNLAQIIVKVNMNFL